MPDAITIITTTEGNQGEIVNQFALIADLALRRFEMNKHLRQWVSISLTHARINKSLKQNIIDTEQEICELRAMLAGQESHEEHSEKTLLAQFREVETTERHNYYLNGQLRQRLCQLAREADELLTTLLHQ